MRWCRTFCRKTSHFWEHFTETTASVGQSKHAKCNYCDKMLKTSHGTSVLSKHLKTCDKYVKIAGSGVGPKVPSQSILTYAGSILRPKVIYVQKSSWDFCRKSDSEKLEVVSESESELGNKKAILVVSRRLSLMLCNVGIFFFFEDLFDEWVVERCRWYGGRKGLVMDLNL